MYKYEWIPLDDCLLHLTSKWGRAEEDSPPIDPPTARELRDRRDARIREQINLCVESGGSIMHLVLHSKIPAGALLDIWQEEIGRVDQYNGKDLTIKMIWKIRRGNYDRVGKT
jgi:hypothetical protein